MFTFPREGNTLDIIACRHFFSMQFFFYQQLPQNILNRGLNLGGKECSAIVESGGQFTLRNSGIAQMNVIKQAFLKTNVLAPFCIISLNESKKMQNYCECTMESCQLQDCTFLTVIFTKGLYNFNEVK